MLLRKPGTWGKEKRKKIREGNCSEQLLEMKGGWFMLQPALQWTLNCRMGHAY